MVDTCVFNKSTAKGQCTIALHVDDMIITGQTEQLLESTISSIGKIFKGVAWCRGPKLTFKDKEVSITMKKYIDDIINKYKVNGKSKIHVDKNCSTSTQILHYSIKKKKRNFTHVWHHFYSSANE